VRKKEYDTPKISVGTDVS